MYIYEMVYRKKFIGSFKAIVFFFRITTIKKYFFDKNDRFQINKILIMTSMIGYL